MSLCKYSDIFGKPGEGSHQYRLFGFAIVDIAATFLGAIIISWAFGWGVLAVFFGLMILSIPIHKLFCVDTALVKALGV